MKTKTIGELLKEARLAAGLDLEVIAEQTRIKREYLLALETNRFSDLPAAVFIKGFITSYARVLEVDPQPWLAMLRRDFKESVSGRLLPHDYLVPGLKKRHLYSPVRMVVASSILASMVLAGYVGWQWMTLNQPPTVTIVSPTELGEVNQEVMVTGRTRPDVTVTINGQPVSLKPDGVFTGQAYFQKDGIATILVEATDSRGKKATSQRQVQVKTK